MTDEEVLGYKRAISEYSDSGDHAEALWGFLGALGAFTLSYDMGKRLGIFTQAMSKAFEYERYLTRKENQWLNKL